MSIGYCQSAECLLAIVCQPNVSQPKCVSAKGVLAKMCVCQMPVRHSLSAKFEMFYIGQMPFSQMPVGECQSAKYVLAKVCVCQMFVGHCLTAKFEMAKFMSANCQSAKLLPTKSHCSRAWAVKSL
jgi:hypothetical protein